MSEEANATVRAAGYIRVSQERNVRDGYGLASQEVDVDLLRAETVAADVPLLAHADVSGRAGALGARACFHAYASFLVARRLRS